MSLATLPPANVGGMDAKTPAFPGVALGAMEGWLPVAWLLDAEGNGGTKGVAPGVLVLDVRLPEARAATLCVAFVV